jgi:iron complex transport system permease protein
VARISLPIRLILLGTAPILIIAVTIGLGYIDISPPDIYHVLLARFGWPLPDSVDPSFSFVIWEVRLPRILCVAMVGGGLAVSGCVFQSLLRNPLADPYTLGISSGAAFGASLGFVLVLFGWLHPDPWFVPGFAFIGALATLAAVFYLTAPSQQLSSNSLILAGIIVSAILSAAISFIKFLADEQVSAIIFWLMGSFIGKTWRETAVLAGISLPCLTVLMCYTRELDIMSFGERTSDALGIETVKIRKLLLIIASLTTSACVAVSGIIGFVGLIVPHFMRLVLGPHNRLLVPYSFLGGCALLLVADTITRVYLPVELPIGILTALLGGPIFCVIFRKYQLARWRS